MKNRAQIAFVILPFFMGFLLGLFLCFSPHAYTGLVATKLGTVSYMAFPGGVEFSAHRSIHSDRFIEASISTYPLVSLYPRHTGLLAIVGTIPRYTVENGERHLELPVWLLAFIGGLAVCGTVAHRHRTNRRRQGV
jgi:hypothetical protein